MKPLRQDLIVWVVRCILGALYLVYLGVMLRQGLLDEIPPQFLVINLLLASIPMLLVLFAVGLLVEAAMQHLLTHRLTPRMGALLRWTPRIGMIIFAVFLSLFALDIFGQGYTLWETVVGLTMHLIPAFALLAVLALAWRWPLVGGVTALLVAAGFILQFGGGWGDDWPFYLTIVGPQVVIGLLFLTDWRLHDEVQHGVGAAPAVQRT